MLLPKSSAIIVSSFLYMKNDGIQYVSSTLESGHYPDITVKAGTPVRWTIHAEKSSINGCNYKILLPDFDTECIFEEGDNTIEFTPQKTGIYTYSCWMGMTSFAVKTNRP